MGSDVQKGFIVTLNSVELHLNIYGRFSEDSLGCTQPKLRNPGNHPVCTGLKRLGDDAPDVLDVGLINDALKADISPCQRGLTIEV
jgi:hypothetical protein